MDTKKVIQTVINKAWEDDNFRQELVSNPNAAIASVTGGSVPANYELVVADQTDPATIYLNIPPKPNFDNMELSDEQLEQVAGGEVFIILTIPILTAPVTITGTCGPLALSNPGGGTKW